MSGSNAEALKEKRLEALKKARASPRQRRPGKGAPSCPCPAPADFACVGVSCEKFKACLSQSCNGCRNGAQQDIGPRPPAESAAGQG